MPLPDGTSTATEVSDQLNRLLVAFKPTHKPGEPLWDAMCAEYAQALRHFPPNSIKLGITRMVGTRKDKFWPTPAEIAEAISDAVDSDRLSRMPRLSAPEAARPQHRQDPVDPEIVFSHRNGQRALEQNVGAQLLDNLNLQREGRMTHGDPAYGRFHSVESADIAWLVAEREESYQVVRGIQAEPFNGAQGLVNLFQAMLDREEKLRVKYLRRIAA